MPSFTCISCRVAFQDGDVQRMHYKSDWHRYNLKRKVAQLPPVTSEEFQRRVLQQRSNDEESVQDKSVYCQVCRKAFGSQKAFENHMNSKRHLDAVKFSNVPNETVMVPCQDRKEGRVVEETSCDSDSEVEEVDSDEWNDDVENPIDNNDCLFCLHHSRNFLNNLKHMTVAHSFFVPDVEYCIDLQGLLRYLGEKVSQGYMCLWCNEKGRTFHSADAARSHMLDKGHCKMLHDGLALAEYADFFDYSTSYPDASKDVDVDEEVEVAELEGNDYQLVLPSGAVVGHRSLMRYYRQSIDPNRQVVLSQNTKKLHKVLAEYRSLGWTATQQEAAAK